jgi:hypothetical protein
MPAPELQLVRAPVPAPARQASAIILGLDERGFVLDLLDMQGAPLRGKRAASCLLEPAVGDRVWCVVESPDNAWVIAVLEREAGDAPMRLSLEGDAELRTREGTLVLAGDRGVEVRTEARVDVHADEVRVSARIGRALLDEGSMILRSLVTHASKSTLIGKVVETLAERITTASQTSLRTVEALDQTRAGAIDLRAQTTAQITAQQTLINGGELAKVDAGQIHLG